MRFLTLTAKPTPRRTRRALGGPARAAGQLELRRGLWAPGGQGSGGTGPDDIGDWRGAPQHLAGDQGVARLQHVAQPQLDRVHTERRCQLVHLGFVCETGLNRPETPHRPTRWVVGPDRDRLDDSVMD